MLIDERDDAVDELLAFEVVQLSQRLAAVEVIVPVGIAAGAAQGTLARDLDRKNRGLSAEYPAPRRQDAFHPASSSNYSGFARLFRED